MMNGIECSLWVVNGPTEVGQKQTFLPPPIASQSMDGRHGRLCLMRPFVDHAAIDEGAFAVGDRHHNV